MHSFIKEALCMDKKRLTALVPAAFLSFTFCVFGPLQMYVTNAAEFFFSISDIWWLCLLCGGILFLCLIAIGFLIPGNWREKYFLLLFGIALAFYIQGNYIPMKYGTLNGEKVDWSAYTQTDVASTLLWFFCLIIPPFIKRFFKRSENYRSAINYISLGIISVQVITLAALYINVDVRSMEEDKSHQLSTEGEFQLSENENIVVFILDAYDSKDFNKFINEHDEYKNTLFKGFIYYPNTVGGATRTVLAVPYILTGYPYIHEEPYREYIEKAFQTTSFYKKLKKTGYTAGIYTEASFVPADAEDVIMNVSGRAKEITSYPKLAGLLLQFTACRYFPNFMKQYVWMYSGDFNQAARNNTAYLIDDAAFYQGLIENRISTDKSDGAFRVYHLMGAHGPYTLDSDANRVDESSAEEQQLGVMRILEEYFQQMKEAGIYDNATIMVMADHGNGEIEYNPMLLIKEKNALSDYKVSKLPVSYQNLQPTFLSLLGENDTGLKSVFELNEADNSERYFYLQAGSVPDYYAIEYLIKGTIPDAETVTETGKKFTIFGAESDADIEREGVEGKFYFDGRATGNAYCISGFSKNEGSHTWTQGNEAIWKIPYSEPLRKDLGIELQLVAQITGYQRVGITINGNFLNWYVVTDRILNFKVPKELIYGAQNLEIRFQLPDAASPSAYEPRLLSLAFYSMTIKEWSSDFEESKMVRNISELDDGVVDFSKDGNSAAYLCAGWYGQEEKHRWSSEKAAMSIIWDRKRNYVMSIDGTTYAGSGEVEVYYNGTNVAVLQGSGFPDIVLPSELADPNGIQIIEFVAQNAVSPKEYEGGADSRTLGISIRSIRFDPARIS